MEEQEQDRQEKNEQVEEKIGKVDEQDQAPGDEQEAGVVMDEGAEISSVEKQEMSTGRRVWGWTAIVLSILVLILVAGGIVGTWVTRGVAIDVVGGLMDGVDRLAGVGREGAELVDSRVGELSAVVGEVETAVDEVSRNISDKGLILTLLPPEKEQELVDTTNRIAETAETILSAIETALDLYTTIDSIPLVNLPRLDEEKVQQIESDVQAVQAGVDQLATDIQQFRDDAAAEIDRVTNAIGEVNAVLGETQGALAQIDEDLALIQTRAQEFADQFATIATIAAIVITLILAWIIYALANTAYGHWQALHND